MAHGLRISPDLELPRNTVTSTLIVYGGKGMGKTNFGGVLVEELTKAHLRWSVLDPLGVWWGLRHSQDGRDKGIECLILGGIHGDIPIEPTGGAVVADLVIDEAVNVIIDFSRRPNGKIWSVGEKIRFVTEYTVRVFERQGEIVNGRRHEPFFQLLDESARYIPQVIPAGAVDLAKCVGAWEQFVEEGRNFGIGVGLLTQRSARMNKSVSELADMIVAFRIVGPRSIKAITDWLGEHLEKDQVNENIKTIRQLDVGDALIVSPGWLKFEKVAHIRMRDTFDSSATPKPGEHRHEPKHAAKPDLAKYQARMAETIERAKANDPRELQAKVAKLEKELAKSGARSSASNEASKRAPAIDQAVMQRAIERAVKIKEADLTFALDRVTKALRRLVEEGPRILEQQAEWIAQFKKTLDDAQMPIVAVHTNGQPLKRETAKALHEVARVAVAHVARDHEASEDGSALPIGEKAVLAAIAQYPAGLQRTQIGVLTGYKERTRRDYVKRLRARGYIEVRGDGQIIASEAGLAALGNDYEPPLTGEARRQKYLRELPAGEVKILEIAIETYLKSPAQWIFRETLGSLTGYKERTLRDYVKRLRARELIEVGREGIRASKELF